MLKILGRDRLHWFAALAVIAACNGYAAMILESIRERGFVSALLSGFAVNPVYWFALMVAAVIAFTPDEVVPMRRGDRPVIAVIAMLALLPIQAASAVALLIAAVWMLMTSPRASRGRRVGAVLLALTASLIWGHVMLMLLGDVLVRIDARFVAWLAGSTARDNLVDFTSGGGNMMIAYACSSMHNMTMAIQMWVAMIALLRISVGPKSLLVGMAALVANVMVNGMRLATIAHDREAYDYWHMGAGAAMFAWLAVVVVSFVVMLGCYALAPRRV